MSSPRDIEAAREHITDSISRRQSTGDVEKEALAAKMSIANRVHEKKQLSAEMKNFRLDTFLDVRRGPMHELSPRISLTGSCWPAGV